MLPCRELRDRRSPGQVFICCKPPASVPTISGLRLWRSFLGRRLTTRDSCAAISSRRSTAWEVTDANYKTLGQYVYDGSVEIAVSQVTWEDNGSTPVLSSKGNIQLGAASFTDPAIYMDKVVGIDGTDKKVGYLLYMGFNIDYDDELMAAFERFRQQNVTDLILDLRYNNGGDVLSSAVLGTLVAGNDYKGQVYAHTTFNEDRTEAGEGGDYKIGVKETVERIYEPLETALQHAVGLKKIYVLVSQTTASASEMVTMACVVWTSRSTSSGRPPTART